jgi:hypothetical protein
MKVVILNLTLPQKLARKARAEAAEAAAKKAKDAETAATEESADSTADAKAKGEGEGCEKSFEKGITPRGYRSDSFDDGFGFTENSRMELLSKVDII